MASAQSRRLSRPISKTPGTRARRRYRASFSLLLAMCLLASLAPYASQGYPVPPSDESEVRAGMFLVAKPSLRDPLFRRTVVLITRHNDEGTIGLIINRPTKVRLSDALPKGSAVESGTARLYVGGPVHPNSLFSLVRSDHPFKGQHPLVGKIYFMAGLAALKEVLAKRDPEVATRSYAGYSGWSPGQLQAEIDRGDWLVIRADTDVIFQHDTKGVWQRLIKNHLGRWL